MKFSACLVALTATAAYGFAPTAFVGTSLKAGYAQTSTSLEMALKPGESKSTFFVLDFVLAAVYLFVDVCPIEI